MSNTYEMNAERLGLAEILLADLITTGPKFSASLETAGLLVGTRAGDDCRSADAMVMSELHPTMTFLVKHGEPMTFNTVADRPELAALAIACEFNLYLKRELEGTDAELVQNLRAELIDALKGGLMKLNYNEEKLQALSDILANYLDYCTTDNDDGLDDHGDATPEMKRRIDQTIIRNQRKQDWTVEVVADEPMSKALIAAIDLHDETMPEHWAVDEALKAEIRADIERMLARYQR